MKYSPSPSIQDLPPVWLELDVRQAFALAYALNSFLRQLGGPTSGLKERLPVQCRELIEAPTRLLITEGR